MKPSQILAAVVAVALLGLAARGRKHVGLMVGGALVLGVYATGLLSALPNPEKVIEDVAQALGPWTYALVGVMAFLETGAFVGLIAPGEFTVILGGVVAGQGEIDIIPLVGLVWAAAVLGDSTSFLIGRRLGREFVMKHGPRVKITHERFEQVEEYFKRHGGKTILIGRFIGLVRALAPFIAGSSGMEYRRFLPYSVLGTGLWATTFSLLGFVFYRSFSQVAEVAGRATVAFGFVVGTIVLVVWAYRRLRQEEERRRLSAWLDRQGRRPLLRPLAAVVRPLARHVVIPAARIAGPRIRFVWGRLTPGNLGLELTTPVAVAAAGLYVFGGYTFILAGDSAPTRADRELLDLADRLQTSWALDIATIVTDFGATPVVVGLVLTSAVLLAVRRKPAEMLALAIGFALVYVAVQLTKTGIDRPRPPDPEVATSNASFPSGHAAYSTAYVAMAVMASRVLPGLASRVSLVAISVLVSAAIGASRMYLHVHYWSDVAAGWGAGFGIFALCGAVALIVVRLRQTRRPPRPVAASDSG